jgi:hypothetical protein
MKADAGPLSETGPDDRFAGPPIAAFPEYRYTLISAGTTLQRHHRRAGPSRHPNTPNPIGNTPKRDFFHELRWTR